MIKLLHGVVRCWFNPNKASKTVRLFLASTLPRRQALAPTPRLRSCTVKRYAALGAEFLHASPSNFTDNSPPVGTPRLLPRPRCQATGYEVQSDSSTAKDWVKKPVPYNGDLAT